MKLRQFVRALSIMGMVAAMSLTAVGAPAQSTAAPIVPTAADFGAPPYLSDLALSPSGNLFAAKGQRDGKVMVVVTDLRAQGSERIRSLPIPDGKRLEWFRWVGDDHLLISLSFAESYEGNPIRTTRLVVYDRNTGEAKQVKKGAGVEGDDVIFVDPDGKYFLLSTQVTLSQYPTVLRIGVDGSGTKVVQTSRDNVWDWYADKTGVVRAGVGRTRNQWWVLYRPDAQSDLTKAIRRKIATDNSNIDQLFIVPGSDQGYAIAAGKSRRFGVYRYDFAKDALGDLVYENPTVDVDGITLAADGSLLSIAYTDDRPRTKWMDPAMQLVQDKFAKALPGHLNIIASMSRDRQKMVVVSSADDDPGTIYLYDAPTHHASAIAEPFSRMTGKRLARMQPVTYKARDGLEIPAYLTLPPGRDPKGLPMVVMPHGGPFARDTWGYDAWAQYLASLGYVVLQPNFRGSTGYGADFVRRGYGQWGRAMQDDIDDGVKWLERRGIVNAKRVCIMGASFGGYAAMWGAERNPDLYRCAISFAGVSDVASMLRYDRKSFAATRYFKDWRDRVQGEEGFDLDAVSPIKHVDQMRIPILIAHGKDDDNVPLYQSRRFHEALDKAGKPNEYVVYPDEGHGFTDAKHATDFLRRVGAFLHKYNPA